MEIVYVKDDQFQKAVELVFLPISFSVLMKSAKHLEGSTRKVLTIEKMLHRSTSWTGVYCEKTRIIWKVDGVPVFEQNREIRSFCTVQIFKSSTFTGSDPSIVEQCIQQEMTREKCCLGATGETTKSFFADQDGLLCMEADQFQNAVELVFLPISFSTKSAKHLTGILTIEKILHQSTSWTGVCCEKTKIVYKVDDWVNWCDMREWIHQQHDHQQKLSEVELEEYKKEMVDFNTKAITKARVAQAAEAAGWSSPSRNITNIEATTAEVATAVSRRMCTAFSYKIQPELLQEIRLLIEESENNVLQELAKAQKVIINNKRRRENDTSFPIFDVSENVDDVSLEAVVTKKKNQPEQHPQKKQRGDNVSIISTIPKPFLKFRVAEVASAVREATKKKSSVYDDSDDDKDINVLTPREADRKNGGKENKHTEGTNRESREVGAVLVR